jgi:DNA repair exonuclease SbcCD ATPase subunit/predicted phosphodiesterase
MLKIAHLGDTHIRNFDRQDQYRVCFKDLYEKLKKENVDCIVHCGDIAHSKTNISPEFVELCTDFLKNLESIAPTYIILGNHDGNLRNLSRQDAITPIVDALELDNLYLLKNSGECQVNDSLTLNVLSVFDEENWSKPSDDSKINIALYHGAVRGSETDIGFLLGAHHGVEIFDGFDFAMLGDIHKSNQIIDEYGRVRYCGSTIQQNHGETPDKGFLVWEIEDADNYNVKHIIIDDPHPHVTIELTEKGSLPRKMEIPEGAIVRVMSPVGLPSSKRRRVQELVRARYNPIKTTVVSRDGASGDSLSSVTENMDIGNLRDVKVQEKLISEYLKEEYNATPATIEKVLQLNKRFESAYEPEIYRNINWSVESLKWNNLFNYGKGNSVNFENLNGIIGIFGKNYSGKSSIIDAFLFALTGSTSKSSVKNVNIINQTKEDASAELVILCDNKRLHISRRLEKTRKNIKSGNPSVDAAMSLDFWSEDCDTGEIINLNGEDRKKTDANIRKYLGTKEDFLMTSFCSQMDSLQFITCGSKDRKKVLSKFLGLEAFERKAKLIKEESATIHGAYKNVKDKDFVSEIRDEEISLSDTNSALEEQTSRCNVLKEKHKKLNEEVNGINVKIASYPKLDIDIDKITLGIEETNVSLSEVATTLSENDKLIAKHQAWVDKADEHMRENPIEVLSKTRDDLREKSIHLSSLLTEAEKLETEKANLTNKISLLSEVPCGDKFPKCKFLQDATVSKGKIVAVEDELLKIKKKSSALADTNNKKELSDAEQRVEKHLLLIKKRNTYRSELSEMRILKEREVSRKKDLERELESLKEREARYHANEKDCQLVADLSLKKENALKKLESVVCDMEECESKVHALIQQKGVCEQKIENLKEKSLEREELRKEATAYEYFKYCMHADGISSQIIKKCLPVINEEISKVLVGIVPFEVFFGLEDKKLEIYIRHPDYDARLIEMASGAEKTIASMAIRLALTKIGTLPKSDIFILDEPATDLDQDNMEGFLRILDMLKSQFKTVMIISHLDALKECVDSEITIDKRDGYAHVEH